MSMRTWKSLGLSMLAAVALAATGCAETATEGSEPTSEAEGAVTEGERPSEAAQRPEANDRAGKKDRARDGKGHGLEGRGGHHGPAMLLHAALRELSLTDAQEAAIEGALDTLKDSLRDGRAEPPAAPPGAAELAAAVRAGRVDEASLLTKMTPPEPDAAHRAAVAKALGTLHATLSAAERRQLVDALSDKLDEHGPGFGGKGFGGKHFGGKHERGERGPRGDAAERGDAVERGPLADKLGRGPLHHLLRDLELRDDQRASIEKAMEGLRPSDADHEARKGEHEARRAQMKQHMELFVAERFDAAAFLESGAKAMREGGRGPMAHMVKALAVVVPVLDEAQRATLADTLAKGPLGMKGMRGHGKRGPLGDARGGQ